MTVSEFLASGALSLNEAEYAIERTMRGTQCACADLLGVHQVTIARRETGVVPITKEASIALLALPLLGK